MMKRLLSILCMLVAAMILCSAPALAEMEDVELFAASDTVLYCSVSGFVKDAEGHAVPDVSISCYDMDLKLFVDMCKTDAQGKWTTDIAVRGDRYLLRFHHQDYTFVTPVVEITAAGETFQAPQVQAKREFVRGAETAASVFTYSVMDGTNISITGYNGSDTAIVIPARINGYVVKAISANAFTGKLITSVILPDSVQTIGASAFQNCTQLAYVGFGDLLSSIESSAFNGCVKLEHIALPNRIKTVGNYAFAKCSSLIDVQMPVGLTTIGIHAFENCASVSEIILPDTVQVLGYHTFAGMTKLEKLVMPKAWNSVTNDSYHTGQVFFSCPSLTEIILPEGMTSLPEDAFYDISELRAISLPSTLKKIGSYAFKNTGLTEIQFPEGLEIISPEAFAGCTGIEEIVLPDSVQDIGYAAFGNCARLQRVTLPRSWSSVTPESYHKGAIFYHCPDLTEITVPEGIVRLPSFAFYDCENLTTINLPSSLKTIGASAFDMCRALESITIPSGVTVIENYAFSSCEALKEIIIPDGVTDIGYRAFANCSNLTSVKLPKAWVTVTNDSYHTGNVFANCSKLTEITIPSGITVLPDHAFEGFDCLKKINFPTTLTKIGASALAYCTSLTELTIPEGVTTLAEDALAGNTAMKTLTLPSTLRTIGASAITNCTALTELTVPSGVTSIAYHAFGGCTSLTSLTLPAAWSTCPNQSYHSGEVLGNCVALKTLTLPEGMTKLPADSLKNCDHLRTVILPASLKSIGESAMSGCDDLRAVWIDSNVTTIASNAFNNDPRLVIHGVAGSVAQTYAEAHNIPFSTARLNADMVTVSGSVKDNAGNAIAAVSVVVFDVTANETVAAVETAANGTWMVEGIPGGHEVLVRYTHRDYLFDEPVPSEALFGDVSLNAVGTRGFDPSTVNTPDADFTYTTINGSFIRITAYTGTDADVVIPTEIDGYIVQQIAAKAFYNNTTLCRVAIPDTVTSIANEAFAKCQQLNWISFGKGLKTIGESAFASCTSLEHVTLPNLLTSIGFSAFENCTLLQSVSMPAGLKSIDCYAFAGCSRITAMNIPDSVTTLGYHTFYNMKAMERLHLPLAWDTMLSSSYHVGELILGCDSLTDIELPEGMRRLPTNAFKYCTNLMSIDLPSTLETLGTACLSHTGLTSIELPEGLKTIEPYALDVCQNLKEIHVPDGVTTLGYNCFAACANLERVDLSVSWQKVLSDSYHTGAIVANCPKLTEITVPEGITFLPVYALKDCANLKSIHLPSTLKKLGEASLSGCTGLASIDLPFGLTRIEMNALSSCHGLTELLIPDTVTEVGYRAFANNSRLKKITFPRGLTNVTTYSYHDPEIVQDNPDLQEVILPEGLTAIPARTFSNSNSIITITIPESVRTIGNEAFNPCTKLQHVWFGNGIEQIADNAFASGSSVILHGPAGSVVEEYARRRGLTFSPLDQDHYYSSITGLVLDEDGNGLPGVTVSVFSVTLNQQEGVLATDEQGSWMFDKVIPGHVYTVHLSTDCHTLDTYEIRETATNAAIFLPAVRAIRAYDPATVDDNPSHFTWEVKSGEYARVTKYIGSADYVSVPAMIDGYIIESIGNNAFEKNMSLRGVVLPETVRAIGDRAFAGCVLLENVGFGHAESIGSNAFEGCVSLREINLPGTMVSIGYEAFYKCANLQRAYLAEGLKTLAPYAFQNCDLLTMDLPDTVTSLAYRVFSNNTHLTRLKLSKSWSEVTQNSYHRGDIIDNCPMLKEIILPEGMTSLPADAFFDCTALVEIHLPSTLKRIGSSAFENCISLKEIELPAGVTGIATYAFKGCKGLTELILPDSVESIGYNAMANCTGLTTITMPMSWKTVVSDSYHDGAIFAGCTNLKTVILPDGFQNLPTDAFYDCPEVTRFVLPQSLKVIGDYAFGNCRGITGMTIPACVTTIGTGAFRGCTGLTLINLPVDLKSIGTYAFDGCSTLTELVIPDGVTTIGCGAFQNCAKLVSLQLPASWTTYVHDSYRHPSVIENDPMLTALELPEGMTTIPEYAFNNAPYLSTVVLPESLVSIGAHAFENCTKLGGADLGKNVTSIGSYAFSGCTKLETVVLPDNLKTVGEYAFNNCTAMVCEDLPPRIASIGRNAFYGTRLQKANMMGGVSSIPAYAFAECHDLTDVTLRRTVTSIADTAFQNSENVFIYCYRDSAAHLFAERMGIPYELLPEPLFAGGGDLQDLFVDVSGTDANGNPVKVKLTVVEYETLKKLTDAIVLIENGVIHVTCEGYYPVEKALGSKKEIPIVMIPESTGANIAMVTCDGEDALFEKISVSTEAGSMTIKVTPSGVRPVRYELMQDASVITTSTSGEFTINPAGITTGKALSVRLVMSGGKTGGKIKTKVTADDPPAIDDLEVTIGDSFKFTVPEDIPLIGGGEIELDMSLIPVFIEKEGDTVRIGIGCKEDLLKRNEGAKQASEWLNWKKFIEDQQENVGKGKNLYAAAAKGIAATGWTKKCSLSVYGYVEGTLGGRNNVFKSVGGKAVMKLSGTASSEWQTVVVVVPVVIKFSISVGVDATFQLGFDFDKAEVYMQGKLDLTIPKVKLSGGVGVNYIADISAYGSGSNIISLNSKNSTLTGTLKGEMGVSASVLFFTYEKSLLKGDWQYLYTSFGNGLRPRGEDEDLLTSIFNGNYDALASLLKEESNYAIASRPGTASAWLGSAAGTAVDADGISLIGRDVNLTAGSNVQQTLQTGVFGSAKPKLVTTASGVRMMVWTADIAGRTTGNHTAVVYSVFDSAANAWSEPAIIQDDGTADFYPQVAAEGDTICVTWVNSGRNDFTGAAAVSDVAASCEISAAVYDAATGRFTVKRLTNNSVADFSPVVRIVNGTICVAWQRNSENDMLGLTGKNVVYYATWANGAWNKAVAFANHVTPVTGLSIGWMDGELQIAYTVNNKAFCGPISGSSSCVDAEHPTRDDFHFAAIGGTDVMMWQVDKQLHYTTDFTDEHVIEGDYSLTPGRYQILNCGGESVLITIQASETGTNFLMYNINADAVSAPVVICSSGKYLGDFHASYKDGSITIAYAQTAVDIGTDSMYSATDLCLLTVGSYSDLQITDIDFDQYAVDDGGKLPVKVTVTNNGTMAENGLNLNLYYGSSSRAKVSRSYDIALASGESTVLDIELPLEAKVAYASSYRATVTPGSGNANASAKNSKTFIVGYPDLMVTATRIPSAEYGICVEVTNVNAIATQAVLRIRKDDANGQIVGYYYLGSMTGRETMKAVIGLNDLIGDVLDETTLYIEVISQLDEQYLTNNTCLVQVEERSRACDLTVNIAGSQYTAAIDTDTVCSLIVTACDASGRMTEATICRHRANAQEVIDMTTEVWSSGCEIRIFQVDDSMIPLAKPIVFTCE